ncbi:histidine phosphatase family protein [Nocardia sp. CY41]|uniref:histidine phosphatase family protein n=1 Tax=Nocardia sp. CY41 TaxID=2608686 RepID=UPI0022A7B57F|nr:histidine phosphatase family protein [Nocardia sp. CY41]
MNGIPDSARLPISPATTAKAGPNRGWARPGGESMRQLSGRATAILTQLAQRHRGGTVVIGSHGTFISRALIGFGCREVDWAFHRAMPMPAIYRLAFEDSGVRATGPGLAE